MGAILPHGLSSSLAQNVMLDLRLTTGAPATGLAYSAVTLKIIFDDDADSPITETLVDGTLGSFVSNGFKEATAGGYQYSIPNARVASAGKRFTIEVSQASIITERFRVIVYDAAKGLGDPTNVDAALSTLATQASVDDVESKVDDLEGRLTAGRAALLDNLANLDASISSLNNLSALSNLFGVPLLEIPDSGSSVYAFSFIVRDNEGKLKNLDGSPTITAANAAGTDRSANLSAVSNPATGRYTFTYTVANDAADESLRITASGTISAEGRYNEWIGAVVDYDTLTTLLAVKSKTDLLPSDPADQSALEAAITAAQDTIAALIAALNNLSQAQAQAAATAALNAYDPATRAEATADKDEILEAVEGGGGGGDTLILAPIVGEVPERQTGVTVTLYTGEQQPTTINVVDGNGDPVDFTEIDDEFTLTIRDARGALVQVASTIDDTLEVDVGSVTFDPDPESTTLKRRGLNYSLRQVGNDQVWQEGPMPIQFATAREEVPAP